MNKKYDFKILLLKNFASDKLSAEKAPYSMQCDIYQELVKYCDVIQSNKFDNINMNKDGIKYIFSLCDKSYYKNSEICVSTLAEYYNIPFFGAQNDVRTIAEDMHLLKLIADYTNVPTLPWQCFKPTEKEEIVELYIEPPYIINAKSGSHSNILKPKIIETRAEATEIIMNYVSNGIEVVAERYVRGDYYTVPVSWDAGTIKIYPSLKCITEKFEDGNTYKNINLFDNVTYEVNKDENLHEQLRKYTLRMFNLLEPIDIAQINYLVDNVNNYIFFTNMDVHCNLYRNSAFAFSALNAGYSYEELFKILLFGSLRRQHLIE